MRYQSSRGEARCTRNDDHHARAVLAAGWVRSFSVRRLADRRQQKPGRGLRNNIVRSDVAGRRLKTCFHPTQLTQGHCVRL